LQTCYSDIDGINVNETSFYRLYAAIENTSGDELFLLRCIMRKKIRDSLPGFRGLVGGGESPAYMEPTGWFIRCHTFIYRVNPCDGLGQVSRDNYEITASFPFPFSISATICISSERKKFYRVIQRRQYCLNSFADKSANS
jgi:hypothetical protein